MRGNPARGENHGQAKLTEEAVRDMRQLRRDGWLLRAIGRAHGVTEKTAHEVCTYKTWRHVK